VLALIGFIVRLPGLWRLIGFTRPSTLRGRRDWQTLFAGRPIQGADEEFDKIRHLRLGPFTDQQLDSILSAVPESIRTAASTPGAREFLAVPETLSLFADVAPRGEQPALYASLVLNEYWANRVGDFTRQTALIQLARAQRKQRSSTIPIGDLINQGIAAGALDSLRNDGVVVIVSGRIGLTQQMLIDFIHARFPDA
jgi:hypothetical protein